MEQLLDSNDDKSKLKLSDLFFKIWTEPNQVFNEIMKHPYKKETFILLFLLGLDSSFDFGYGFHTPISLPFTMLVGGILAVILGFIFSFVALWTGSWFNGQAGFKDLLKVTAFSSIPIIIGNLISLAFLCYRWFSYYNMDDPNQLIGVQYNYHIYLILILSIWSLVLFGIGLRKAQKFSIFKTIFNLIVICFLSILLGIGFSLF